MKLRFPFKFVSNSSLEELMQSASSEAVNSFYKEHKDRFPEEGKEDTNLDPRITSFANYFSKNKIESTEVKDLLFSSIDTVPEVDLELGELQAVQDTIWTLYARDPILRGVVDTFVEYIMGAGITVSTPSHEVNTRLEKFRKMNTMVLKEREIVKNVYMDGEYFNLIFYSKKSGNCYIRKAHPKTITEIEVVPSDIETPLSYKQEYQTDYNDNSGASDRWVKDINYERVMKDDIWDVKSKHTLGGTLVCQHMKLNDSDKMRGLPPLRVILKWLKYYQNFIIDRMVLNHERAKVVWVKNIAGRALGYLKDKFTSPRGGTMLVERDGVTYRTEKPNLDSSEAKEDALNLLYYIGSAVRFPLHILNQRTDQQVYASADLSSTEFLTNRGWLYLKDIDKDNDLAGTINPFTHKFEWQNINGTTSYWHEGDMYHIKSSATDLICTPNHDLYTAGGSATKSKRIKKEDLGIEHFHKKRADEAYNSNMHWVVCQLDWDDSQTINFNNTKQEAPDFIWYQPTQYYDWLRFIGFYIGDGSISFSGYSTKDVIPSDVKGVVAISQMRKDGIQYLTSLAKSLDLNINITEKEGKDRYVFSIPHSYPSNLIISHWFKDHCGHSSYNKKIPDFIFGLPKIEQEIFFEGLMMSDGSFDSRPGRTNMTYSTRSKQLSEDVFIITLKLGYRSRIITQQMADIRYIKGRRIIDGKIKYHVKFVDSGGTELLTNQRNNIQKIKGYKGQVGCLNVDNGIIITRSNGKIAIHGNSIKKADTPFAKMIESYQLTFATYFEKYYRFYIEMQVKYGGLEKTSKYKKFEDDSVLMAINYLETVGEKVKKEVWMEEASRLMDEDSVQITVDTVDIPISIDFPQMALQDPKEMAEVLKYHLDMGIASRATLSAKAGYTWIKEKARKVLEEEDELVTMDKKQEITNKGVEAAARAKASIAPVKDPKAVPKAAVKKKPTIKKTK